MACISIKSTLAMACLAIKPTLATDRLEVVASHICAVAEPPTLLNFIIQDTNTKEPISNASIELYVYDNNEHLIEIYRLSTDESGAASISIKRLGKFYCTISHPFYGSKTINGEDITDTSSINVELLYKWDFRLVWYDKDYTSEDDYVYLTEQEVKDFGISLGFYYIIPTVSDHFDKCAEKLSPIYLKNGVMRVPMDFYTADYDEDIAIDGSTWQPTYLYLVDYIGGYASVLFGKNIRSKKLYNRGIHESSQNSYNYNFALAYPGIIFVYKNQVITTEDGRPICFDTPNNLHDNLLLDSEVETLGSAGSNNYSFKTHVLTVDVKPSTIYTFSVDKTEILKGSEFDRFTVAFYDLGADKFVSNRAEVIISSSRQTALIGTASFAAQKSKLLVYNGIYGSTAGKQIRLTRFKLEEGTVATPWTPGEYRKDSQMLIEGDNPKIYAPFTSHGYPEEVNENILRGSMNMTLGVNGWPGGNWRKSREGTVSVVDIADAPVVGVTKGIKLTNGVGQHVGLAQDTYPNDFNIGDVITLSVYAKANKPGVKLSLKGIWKSPISSGLIEVTLNGTGWQRIHATSEPLSTAITGPVSIGYVYNETPDSEVIVCAMKEEFGSEMTGWSPNPLDDQGSEESDIAPMEL